MIPASETTFIAFNKKIDTDRKHYNIMPSIRL